MRSPSDGRHSARRPLGAAPAGRGRDRARVRAGPGERQLHPRPRGRGVRSRIRALLGGEALRRRGERDRCARDRAAGRRHRPGRRGDRAGQLVHRDGAGGGPRGRRAGAGRLRSGSPSDRRRRGTEEDRAAHAGDRRGAPLRADGADGGARGAGVRVRPRPGGGCRAGPRCAAPRTDARHVRARRRHELLSGQEPRRLRRRGRGPHRPRHHRSPGPCAAQLWKRGEVCSPGDRLQLAPRPLAGGRAERQARAPASVERATPRSRPPL